jgi:hypothetical protein
MNTFPVVTEPVCAGKSTAIPDFMVLKITPGAKNAEKKVA